MSPLRELTAEEEDALLEADPFFYIQMHLALSGPFPCPIRPFREVETGRIVWAREADPPTS